MLLWGSSICLMVSWFWYSMPVSVSLMLPASSSNSWPLFTPSTLPGLFWSFPWIVSFLPSSHGPFYSYLSLLTRFGRLLLPLLLELPRPHPQLCRTNKVNFVAINKVQPFSVHTSHSLSFRDKLEALINTSGIKTVFDDGVTIDTYSDLWCAWGYWLAWPGIALTLYLVLSGGIAKSIDLLYLLQFNIGSMQDWCSEHRDWNCN